MVERYGEKLNEKDYQKLLLKKGGGGSSDQELTRAESFILAPVCCLSWKTDRWSDQDAMNHPNMSCESL